MTDQARIFLKRVVVLVVLAGILALAWVLLVERAFLTVKLPDGMWLKVTDPTTNRTVVSKTSGSLVYLKTGTYVVSYGRGVTDLGFNTLKLGPGVHKLTPETTDTASQTVKPIFSNQTPADHLVPLADGYLYLDSTSRDVSYVTSVGKRTSLSGSLNLSKDAIDPSSPIYNTAFNIQKTKSGGAIVSTTLGVFLVNDPTDIQQLPLPDNLNFMASAYDGSTNQLYLLASDSKDVYSYDLSHTEQAPAKVFSAPGGINRVAAGGNKVVVYFDNVPSTDPAIVSAYNQKHQLKPLVFDTSTGKFTTIGDYPVVSYFSVSGDGTYAAYKEKSATVLAVRNLATNKMVATIPAPDTGAGTWSGDSFYFGAHSSLWQYTVSTNAVKKVSSIGTSLNYIYADSATILGTTAAGTLVTFSQGNSAPNPPLSTTPVTQSVSAPVYQYYSPGGF